MPAVARIRPRAVRSRPEQGVIGAVAAWFGANARPLPWRQIDPATGRRDPYRSLVSEFMLQQTQVARVLEKFGPFMRRFPSVESLAAADERDVLAAWSGLGYYRRARNLHACAREIVARFGGRVPREIDALMALPGVGRYTAGAIASIVFDQGEPILDGNVARVLLRVEGRDLAPDSAAGRDWLWSRAEALARTAAASGDAAAFNEGLMELGATVCTPRAPDCARCPVAAACRARRDGSHDRIPPPKRPAARERLVHSVVVARRGGRVLLERRADTGLWAGMWQAPTLETRGPRAPGAAALAAWIGVPKPKLRRIDGFVRQLTHREVEFRVWELRGAVKSDGRQWVDLDSLNTFGISNPQRRILTSPPAAG